MLGAGRSWTSSWTAIREGCTTLLARITVYSVNLLVVRVSVASTQPIGLHGRPPLWILLQQLSITLPVASAPSEIHIKPVDSEDAAEDQARYEDGCAGEDMGSDKADDWRDAMAGAMWRDHQSVVSQSS
ncbi:hypothetical protein SISNIDRAFT_462250 [Sistotremastrum niveocremeum HHB9708]|uniref:Uncharacterized protein n=1 Tax=Sistotremastrum niveocremeum HHB9708 TaxID=1314777 RepID=A0A164ZYA2_9AGAM|nr:hypothetical protein SISNIDRAFT_467015 [Sistotremastrum niveocremeum HHB9708]KZS98228.1 hypothetical protein SISNIDRAFT_462250 [Sistotremastrum niveocremeum HHB9708]